MPHDQGLPQTGDSQEIGQDAYDCLRAKRPKGWQLTELGGVNDYGFDLQVQISVDQQVVHPFRLQLKGTRSPKLSADGSFLSIALSTSTLRYFDNTDEPVLLVLCDLSIVPEEPRDCPLYFVWIREELERIQLASIPLHQAEAVIRVPTLNALERSTDLVAEVRKRHRLSRVGHALDQSVAQKDPTLGSDDRVVMVEAITKGIASRGIVLAQALAEPATDFWVNPPRGSSAWLLTEARLAMASGRPPKCDELLGQASEQLATATSIEQAEYWHLMGRSCLVRGDDAGASKAFKTAAEVRSHAKHWSAWAESELRRRHRAERDVDFSDLLSALPADRDPSLLSVKARLLAASKKYDEAIALLDTFDGSESLAGRAVVETMFSKSTEALQACIAGLSANDKTDSNRLLFLILKARARFNIALQSAQQDSHCDDDALEDEIIPPSGPIGVDALLLKDAWNDIQEAVDAIEETRWVTNGEFVIDIWIAASSMLGRQKQIIARVLAAARMQPHQPELQLAAETLAAQCGDFAAALEANGRLPQSDTQVLRRASFLHELEKHRDCVELMAAHVATVNRSNQLFGRALVLAAISADVMARTDLVDSWRDILNGGDPESKAHAATLDYLLAKRRSPEQGDAPLSELLRIDEELGHPTATTLALFEVLDIGSRVEAERFIQVATRLRATFRLSPGMAQRIAVALATLAQWEQLLALCEEAEREFDVAGRAKAFHALALDQLGRSDDARIILESMLEDGVDDPLALNTYVNIMVRWGFTEKAKSAVELILEGAQARERRIECVQMLYKLEQHANSTSPRLLQLACRMGELTNQDDEAEEGAFLCMVIGATSFETVALSQSRIQDFQGRANAFFSKFPQSKIIWRIDLPTDGDGDQMIRALKSAVGITDEQEQARAEIEAKLQSGELPFPFAWRPRIAFGNVQDVVHLWEIAKTSAAHEKRFHLDMVKPPWEQRAAESFRSKTPLLDLLTLLILMDLGLLDKLFDFFPKVAIPQRTLRDLMKMSQAFSGSVYRSRCIALQDSLRSRLSQIIEPRGELPREDEQIPKSSRELKKLMETGEYILYSDDAVIRLWILEDKFNTDGLCTLDLLCALEETGALTVEDVAASLLQLCEWHVGIQIQLRHQLALIPPAAHNASSVVDATTSLRGSARFMSMANAMWGPHTDLMNSLQYIGAVVRELVHDSSISNAAVGAFVAIWIERITTTVDEGASAPLLAAEIVLFVAAPSRLSIGAMRRLWRIYLGVVEVAQGPLSRDVVVTALMLVGHQAGTLDKRISKENGTPQQEIGERLMLGFNYKSDAPLFFSAAYLQARR